LSDVLSELQLTLKQHGQSHLLHFWDGLDAKQQDDFVNQLNSIDFDLLSTLQKQPKAESNQIVCPASVLPSHQEHRMVGIRAIEKGELGVLTVAGGDGTRLGWSGPKGTFPSTPITGKSLFQLVAEQILFASRKYGVTVPWYIMTSKTNDEITRSFLLDNNCFGLERTDIFLCTQGEMPAVDAEGKIMLASKGKVAMNPDGHGGVLAALQESGAFEEMDARGIKHLSYVQIDNPMARVVDPDFLGFHLSETSSKEVTSKCVQKVNPTERVGVFCDIDGKTTIVEYSDLSEAQSKEVTDCGELKFHAGSIAIHMMSVEFLKRIADDLPWHKAFKKVNHIDLETGNVIDLAEPNAFKYERFVFDILPLATSSLVIQTEREEEFAPIKNAEGEDSVQTSTQLQLERARRWLRSSGVSVSDNLVLEISPTTAASPEDLLQIKLPDNLNEEDMLVL